MRPARRDGKRPWGKKPRSCSENLMAGNVYIIVTIIDDNSIYIYVYEYVYYIYIYIKKYLHIYIYVYNLMHYVYSDGMYIHTNPMVYFFVPDFVV